MSFEPLGLSEQTLKALADAGYTNPTPIQEKAIPTVLMGRDVLGVAQTGTGKTAGFTLPMIDILSSGRGRARMPRSLILEPTRELAAQVAESFEKYGKYHDLSMALLIGGESMKDQQAILTRGVDVLIATPGRLLDLFDRGQILLADTKLLVIDEADRMLDMGFIPDVERIVSFLPPLRQTLFFSATMAKEIRRLADQFLHNPKEISVAPEATTAETVSQFRVPAKNEPKSKRATLRALLLREQDNMQSALIFANRKRDVGIVARSLERHGFDAQALHGDMVQSARMEALNRFKKGEIKILVCSDVAARGLDIPAVSHVFNYDVPSNSEDYVHRIGRTGRAGRSGKAYTLVCGADDKAIKSVLRLIKKDIPLLDVEGNSVSTGEAAQKEAAPKPERSKPEQQQAKPEQQQAKPEQERTKPERQKNEHPKNERPRRRAKSQADDIEVDEILDAQCPFGGNIPAFLLRRPPLSAGA